MANVFEPCVLPYDSNISTADRRLYSTILAGFPWYSEALVLKPTSILSHCENLPAFSTFLSSLHGFEDELLHFVKHPHMKEIRRLLGMNVITDTDPEHECLIVASHESTLSLYDFQKICSVLCAYRFFEIISLRAQCISRIPNSSPIASLFLPGPPSVKEGLEAFSRLQEWPDLVVAFRDLVKNATDEMPEFRPFPNPVFSLMHMIAKNNVASKYLAIEENFLFAAIYVAALKNIPFSRGAVPDLPANIPFAPSGGFKDQESYDRFEAEFNTFTKTCQGERSSQSAHVSFRSPFQLAVMISPLYLLVTRRLSTKSFHRRTVIDMAARLGPHKPSRVLAIENIIWDAILRLAEGRTSSHAVLRDLANCLPWSDINIASNCEEDKQWFAPKFPIKSNSTVFLATLSNSVRPNPLPISIGPIATNALHQKLPIPLLSTMHAPGQSGALLPPPYNLEALAGNKIFSTIRDDGDGNSIEAIPSFHGISDLDFNIGDDLSTESELHPRQSLECSLDLSMTLINTEDNHPELDSFGSNVAAAQYRIITPMIHNESDTNTRTAAECPDDGRHVGQLIDRAGSINISTNSCEGLSDGENRRKQNLARKPTLKELQNSTSSTGSVDSSSDDSEGDSDDDSKSSETHIAKQLTLRKLVETRPPGPRQTRNSGYSETLGARKFNNSSAKRRRSSSSLSSKRLGSKENPIDVDKIASLFEPMVVRDYVKKEEISLPSQASPPIRGHLPYTVFDATGEPHTFTPSFHFQVYHERFRQFMNSVLSLDDHSRLLHVERRDVSIVKSFSYEEWKILTPAQMQQEQRQKNIIVTGWPVEKILFDEDGLRKVAGMPSRQISINDYSIKPGNNTCGPTVVSGLVRNLWDNRHPTGKILNALDLPLYDGNIEPTGYTSDLHAWDVTRGYHHTDQSSPYPIEHMRWALAGHENTLTFLHIDCEGLSTDITVTDGGKAWGFLRERPGNSLSSINFFLKDSFRLDEVLPSSEYDFELVALRPGDRLFMMPGQPHFVFGYAHTICLGGHYYLTDHMQKTLQAFIHSFILHKFLTNTSHPTWVILRRMVLFYHMGLIENEISRSDPAASHLPKVDTIDGLMDLLSVCVLVILGNVLDFRTYRAPTQEEYTKADKKQQILINHEINTIPLSERFAVCYARGVALRLIDWIRHCAIITGPGGEIVSDLSSRFFVQIAQTLIKYKEGANASKLDLQANCTLDLLVKQIDNVVAVNPHILSMWSERHLLPSDSLALADQDKYSIQWLPEIQQQKWASLPYDFFCDGVTGLDECHFNTQQDRHHLESTLVIPKLKMYASGLQRPSKQPRLG